MLFIVKKIEVSKFLSYVLRHNSQSIGLSINSEGWLDIEQLVQAANQNGQNLDRALIDEVVEKSEKKRFAISNDGLKIRAVQGHSNEAIDLTFMIKEPPDFLYHGTSNRFLQEIQKVGLKPMSRQYVHLSEDIETAIAVGTRHGKPVVLSVNTTPMLNLSFEFARAENGVWLIKEVPKQYLEIVDITP